LSLSPSLTCIAASIPSLPSFSMFFLISISCLYAAIPAAAARKPSTVVRDDMRATSASDGAMIFRYESTRAVKYAKLGEVGLRKSKRGLRVSLRMREVRKSRPQHAVKRAESFMVEISISVA